MDRERTEAAAEGDVLLGRDVLIAQHEHALAVEKAAPHRREGRVVERLRQVEADDLGPERRRETAVTEARFHRQCRYRCHGGSIRLPPAQRKHVRRGRRRPHFRAARQAPKVARHRIRNGVGSTLCICWNRFVSAPSRCATAWSWRRWRGRGRIRTGCRRRSCAEYYAQRAGVGLIVTEASSVSPLSVSRPGAAAIFRERQAEGWRGIAQAVHAKGGVIFQQLYHLGRKSDPSRMPEGTVPVAPSAIAAEGEVAGLNGPVPFATPRALATEEIPGIVAEFRRAAANARGAGMDGVEIHGANAYLIDEFLRDGTNRRTDRYGGTVENRARLLVEVVEAAIGVFGADRVGVRLSPHQRGDGIADSDPAAMFGHAAAALDTLGIAYLHLIEAIAPGLPQSPPDGAMSARADHPPRLFRPAHPQRRLHPRDRRAGDRRGTLRPRLVRRADDRQSRPARALSPRRAAQPARPRDLL